MRRMDDVIHELNDIKAKLRIAASMLEDMIRVGEVPLRDLEFSAQTAMLLRETADEIEKRVRRYLIGW